MQGYKRRRSRAWLVSCRSAWRPISGCSPWDCVVVHDLVSGRRQLSCIEASNLAAPACAPVGAAPVGSSPACSGAAFLERPRMAGWAKPMQSPAPQIRCFVFQLPKVRSPVTVHGRGTGSFFGPFRGEKCACPLPAREGQSHFRGVRRENRECPCEWLRSPKPPFTGQRGTARPAERPTVPPGSSPSVGPKGLASAGLCRRWPPGDRPRRSS